LGDIRRFKKGDDFADHFERGKEPSAAREHKEEKKGMLEKRTRNLREATELTESGRENERASRVRGFC